MKHIKPYRIFEGDGGGEGLSFDQLSPEAKQKAISNYEPYHQGWSEDTINNFVDDMMEYGVDVDAGSIEWDDSFDLWFKGKVWFVDNLNFINAIGMKEEVAKSENKFLRAEGDAYPEFWKDLYITINHSIGRNPYSKAMFITIEDIDDEQISTELVDEIEQKGNEWVREKAAELGKQLDAEWDYMHSEESAEDYYENMDTRFNPDGTEI